MDSPPDEHLAYATLARQAAHVERRLPAARMARLAETAPGRADVLVDLEFRSDGSGRTWVRGHAEQIVDATCQRCLEQVEYRLLADFDLCIVREGADLREVSAGADVLVVEGETVAIAEIVEDELLLGLPERLCREEPCGYAPGLSYPADVPEVAEAADDVASPFSVLATLKRADS